MRANMKIKPKVGTKKNTQTYKYMFEFENEAQSKKIKKKYTKMINTQKIHKGNQQTKIEIVVEFIMPKIQLL